MVLGMKSKRKKGKGAVIRVEYIVHVQEIRPWPPSESFRSVQTVLLQWENGSENSGSFISVAGDANIVFNESFTLPVTLYHKKASDKFHKNYVEFSLSEPRKDKAKAKLLGKASLNLAEYGLDEDIVTVNAPLSLKKSSDNTVQPALAITLELVEKDCSPSPSVGLSQEASMDNDDDDYSERASFTDDDASSHSSRTTGSLTFEVAMASPSQSDKIGHGKTGIDPLRERNRNFWPSSADASPDSWNKVKDYVSSSKFTERSMSYAIKNSASPLITSSPSSISFRETNGKYNKITPNSVQDNSLYSLASHEKEWPSEGNKARIKHVKSVKYHNSAKGNVFPGDTYTGGKPPDLDIPNGSQKRGKVSSSVEKKEAKSDGCSEWKLRVEMLEGELREAAAVEVGLYSVVPEHLCSKNKVHAPARRLSRFYKNACSEGSQARRASAAKAAVSGLVLVSKACGNDVSRLTFWLSNSIMLRSIISQMAAELPHSNGSGGGPESDDLEDVLTFLIALERVESWLFSRIVESVWWQTFTPHMQPNVSKSSKRSRISDTKKTSGRRNSLGSYEQGSFSIELWKKAFKDACERLCPIRAGGHECGCLSALVILVMEQLVNRLDVAMFNAILRESAEDMPTDPLSDPISDSKVLPVPPGKSSFTAGAQLKNIIGNWSRWLTDIFGLEDEDNVIQGNGNRAQSFKAFRLLHALSDLMMLPFGMLVDASTRKEVCPTFGPSIIKRVLNNFVPDEFSPNPIPRYIIDALSSEETRDGWGQQLLNKFPYSASPTKYAPPPAALLTCVGEVGKQVVKSSRLSTLQKSYTSEDELDELECALSRVIPDNSSALARLSLMPKEKGGTNVVRYQLLREIWRDE